MREKIDLIFSAVHVRCDGEIRQRDPGIESQADLDALFRKTLWEGKLETLTLHCTYCNVKLNASHVEISLDGEIAMDKREVERFIPFDFKMILN